MKKSITRVVEKALLFRNTRQELIIVANTRRSFTQFSILFDKAQSPSVKTIPSGKLVSGTVNKNERQNLVILGSGWAGFRTIKTIDMEKYNVFLVTPRNHFLFTPLLPGAACGTVELRSIIEPVRRAVVHDSKY